MRYYKYYDLRLNGFLFLGVLIFFVFIFCVCLSNKSQCGALYFDENGKPVFICEGTLKTISGYSTRYSFVCNDGRVLNNLTNFTLMKRGEK